MSSCGNCDCADKTQCPKKGNTYGVVIIEADKKTFEVASGAATYGEHDGKCKCGANCNCTDCGCGKYS